ncbi:MAG: hypothetical protein KDA78_01405 [Planctomycetaceae bacterium]|nr:hypothetical protein [Planctomycetaceae bacterium]
MFGAYALRGDDPIFEIIPRGSYQIYRLTQNPVLHSYESRHHEFNRLYKLLGESPEPMVLFDFEQCLAIDSILVSILVDLTYRCRDLDGNAVITNISQELMQMVDSLMQLQPNHKRAKWTLYPNIPAAEMHLPW